MHGHVFFHVLLLCADQLDVPVADLHRQLHQEGSWFGERAIPSPPWKPAQTRKEIMSAPATWVDTPCCSKVLHVDCVRNCAQCTVCHVPLKVLPCGVCREQISTATDIYEAYRQTYGYRLVCCGADCHPSCARSICDTPRSNCPVCRTPLKLAENRIPTKNPLELNTNAMEWWHFVDMRKEERYNDQRRQKGLSYDDRPDLLD